jgi:hypothetical protein
MDMSETLRLKALADKNRWLKMLVAELGRHSEVLKGVSSNNSRSLPV